MPVLRKVQISFLKVLEYGTRLYEYEHFTPEEYNQLVDLLRGAMVTCPLSRDLCNKLNNLIYGKESL